MLSDRLHMVQGFTDDETRLMAAIDTKKTKSRTSQLLIADTGATDSAPLLASEPSVSASSQQAQGVGPGSSAGTSTQPPSGVGIDPAASGASGGRSSGAATPVGGAAIEQMLKNAEADKSNYFLEERIRVTVHAFTDVARFVSSLPGRKNLIWMLGSFPVEIWPGRKQATDDVREFNIAFLLEPDIRAAQQALKESRVAV